MLTIRRFTENDTSAILALFYDTVHHVNAAHYTPAQLDVWAPSLDDKQLAQWQHSLMQHDTFVAILDDRIVGFSDVAADGYLDRLYVHKDYQRRGIATALLKRIEQATGAQDITTYASITAKPFFEHHGYEVVRQQVVVRRGIELINFHMLKKRLGHT